LVSRSTIRTSTHLRVAIGVLLSLTRVRVGAQEVTAPVGPQVMHAVAVTVCLPHGRGTEARTQGTTKCGRSTAARLHAGGRCRAIQCWLLLRDVLVASRCL